MVGFCEHGNELSSPMKCMEFLDYKGFGSFSSSTLLHAFTILVVSFTSCLPAFGFNTQKGHGRYLWTSL